MFLFIFFLTFGESICSAAIVPHFSSSSITSLPQSYPSCFTEGMTWSPLETTEIIPGILTLYSCQKVCLQSPHCQKFTWYDGEATPLNFACILFDETTSETACTNCVSGPQSCQTTCDVPKPHNHGDWFCVPSSSPSTCHLECDPGYVTNNGSVITCNNGEWSSSPRCVEAVALITGRYNTNPDNTVELYAEGLHKKLPNLPDGRGSHSLDLVNSVILLCGGDYSSTQTSCLSMTSSNQWTYHSTTLYRRMNHNSVSMLGKLHLLSGQFSTSTTEVLTPPSDQWNQGWDLIEPTYESCSAKISPELLIITGGINASQSVLYNVTSGAAERLQNLLTGRFYHGCAYVTDPNSNLRGVLVAGGYHAYSVTDSSEMYDIASGQWSATGELTSRKYDLEIVVLGENILALGGKDQDVYSSVDKFNLTSKQWKTGEDMLEPRRAFGVTAVPPNAVGIGQD